VDAGTKRPVEWAQGLAEMFENKAYF
jgi:hypothetical protein